MNIQGRKNVSSLTAGELGGILACIDAKRVVKRSSLTFCTNINGSGLELYTRAVDLCMVEEQ